MAKEIRMPDLGTAVKEVTLIAWLKQEGDHVQRGEPLCEVETDKATSILESVAQGVLLKQVAPAGSSVTSGAVIAWVGAADEVAPLDPAEAAAGQATTPAQAPADKAEHPIRVSPMIRNLAERLGVDLGRISGSGPGGQITRTDIMQAKKATERLTQAAPSETSLTLSRNQLGVARTIAASWREVIPINVQTKINMGRVLALREMQGQRTGQKPAFDAIVVHVVAKVLEQTPRFRCHFENEQLMTIPGVNVGVAVSVGEDLFIPVIKEAQHKSFEQIDGELRRLVEKAGQGSLNLEEMAGAALTISNLGMLPVESFTAIIPPRQSAILTIGQVQETVVFRENRMAAAEKIATVILAVDHRFINGRQAAEFLARIKNDMENL